MDSRSPLSAPGRCREGCDKRQTAGGGLPGCRLMAPCNPAGWNKRSSSSELWKTRVRFLVNRWTESEIDSED